MNLDTMRKITIEYGITMEMLYVLLLMYYKNREEMKAYGEITRKYRPSVLTEDEKNDLVEMGLIKRMGEKKFDVTEKFTDIFIDKDVAALEFFNEYPSFIHSKGEGKSFPLKNVDIRVFQDLYHLLVKTKSEHKAMMQMLQYAKANSYGFVKIENFLRNKVYEQIIQDMEQSAKFGNSTTITNNYL